jgi:hypothetical protein
MKGPPLTIVQDAAHRRAVIEDYLAARRMGLCDGGGGTGRGHDGVWTPLLQHRAFNRSQTAHPATQPYLGVAIQRQHRLGQSPEKVIAAISMRYMGELRRDAGHEGLLFVRHP